MRDVPVKTPEQQAVLTQHRTRALLVKQRTSGMLRGAEALPDLVPPPLRQPGSLATTGRTTPVM